MITLTIIAVSLALMTDTPVDVFVDWFIKVAPLLAALGLFELAATAGRKLWNKFTVDAAASPTKVDDFLVHILDAPVKVALDLLAKGDVKGAEDKIRAIHSLIPKR